TRRQQEQEAAERQAIETLDDPKLHGRPILFFWLVRSTPAYVTGLWFQVLCRRIVARINRVLQEGRLVIGPELTDIRIGLDDRIDQPAVALGHFADIDVTDCVAELIELDDA